MSPGETEYQGDYALDAGMSEGVDPATVLVAIPALDEAAFIGATLDALMAGSERMTQVTIVVADGGSTDATRSIVEQRRARYPNIRLIDNPGRLQSAGVNRVVEQCATPRHRILVRVDAHSHYPPGYVLAVADSLLAHDTAALATVMDSVGDSCFQRGAAWAMETRLGSGGSGHRGGVTSGYVDHGHHAGFRLDIWRKVGGYDTGFAANEDAELDHRIGQAGGRIWLDANIRLGYVMRPTLRKLARQYWRYGKGRAQTILRHSMRPRLRQMIPPVVVLAHLTALPLAVIWPPALFVPLAYVLILCAVALSLALRHRSLCAIWAAPALLAMHHAWGAGFLWHMARHITRERGSRA